MHSLLDKGVELPEEVVLLADKPFMMVRKYKSYSINGCIFHTRSHTDGKSTQCDGVSMTAKTSSYSSAKDKNPVVGDVEYYGRIIEIVELNYSNEASVVMFKCEWTTKTGIRVDDFGITEINFKHLNVGKEISSEPFILASQAKQIYYLQDPIEDDWHAVVTPSTKYYDMDPVV